MEQNFGWLDTLKHFKPSFNDNLLWKGSQRMFRSEYTEDKKRAIKTDLQEEKRRRLDLSMCLLITTIGAVEHKWIVNLFDKKSIKWLSFKK